MANTRRTLDWFPRPLSATTPDLNGAPPPGTLIAFAMVARSRLVRIHMRSHDSTTTDSRYFCLPPARPAPCWFTQSAGTAAEATSDLNGASPPDKLEPVTR